MRAMLVVSLLLTCAVAVGQDRVKGEYMPKDALRDLRGGTHEGIIRGAEYFLLHPDKYSRAAGDALLAALGRPEGDRLLVVNALAACKEQRAVERFLEMLEKDPDKTHLMSALGVIGDKRALAPLLRLTRRYLDDKREVPCELAGGVAALCADDEASVPVLLRLTHSTDAKVRRSAAEGLGRTRSKKAIGRLGEMIAAEDKGFDAELERMVCAGALAHIGTEDATGLLLRRLRKLSERYWRVVSIKQPEESRLTDTDEELSRLYAALAATRRASALAAVIGGFDHYAQVDLRVLFNHHTARSVLWHHLKCFENLSGKQVMPDGFEKTVAVLADKNYCANVFARCLRDVRQWSDKNLHSVRERAKGREVMLGARRVPAFPYGD